MRAGGTFYVPSGQLSERASMNFGPPSARPTIANPYRAATEQDLMTTESDTMSISTPKKAGRFAPPMSESSYNGSVRQSSGLSNFVQAPNPVPIAQNADNNEVVAKKNPYAVRLYNVDKFDELTQVRSVKGADGAD